MEVYSPPPPLQYTVLDLWASSPGVFYAHCYPSGIFTMWFSIVPNSWAKRSTVNAATTKGFCRDDFIDSWVRLFPQKGSIPAYEVFIYCKSRASHLFRIIEIRFNLLLDSMLWSIPCNRFSKSCPKYGHAWISYFNFTARAKPLQTDTNSLCFRFPVGKYKWSRWTELWYLRSSLQSDLPNIRWAAQPLTISPWLCLYCFFSAYKFGYW